MIYLNFVNLMIWMYWLQLQVLTEDVSEIPEPSVGILLDTSDALRTIRDIMVVDLGGKLSTDLKKKLSTDLQSKLLTDL